MNVEWSIPFRLETPAGSLTFNDPTNPIGLFLLLGDRCKMGSALRLTKDDIPQASGSIFHKPRLQSETLAQLTVGLWASQGAIACDRQLRVMHETLVEHLQTLLDGDTGRLFWQPTGYGDERFLDAVMWASDLVPTVAGSNGSGETELAFELDSPFPYALDKTEVSTVIGQGTSATVTNAGNTPVWPVMRVAPSSSVPAGSFTITNESVLDPDGNPFFLFYDSELPGGSSIGAGHFAELDFFRNTIYLDGDSTNLKPGIDITRSDFFPLNPGPNVITVAGADVTVLSNNAWGG